VAYGGCDSTVVETRSPRLRLRRYSIYAAGGVAAGAEETRAQDVPAPAIKRVPQEEPWHQRCSCPDRVLGHGIESLDASSFVYDEGSSIVYDEGAAGEEVVLRAWRSSFWARVRWELI
jgi:hypothetical protein